MPGRPHTESTALSRGVVVRVSQGEREAWKAAAAGHGMTLAAWVRALVRDAMRREGRTDAT